MYTAYLLKEIAYQIQLIVVLFRPFHTLHDMTNFTGILVVIYEWYLASKRTQHCVMN